MNNMILLGLFLSFGQLSYSSEAPKINKIKVLFINGPESRKITCKIGDRESISTKKFMLSIINKYPECDYTVVAGGKKLNSDDDFPIKADSCVLVLLKKIVKK